MTNETTVLIGLGIGAVILVWLVFSIFKKLFGIVFMLALAAGIYYLWTHPTAMQTITNTVESWIA